MATAQEALLYNKNHIYPMAGFAIFPNISVTTSRTIIDSDFIVSVNTAAGAVVVTLPAAPSVGEFHWIFDSSGNANANNLIINGNGKTISGANSLLINTSFGARLLRYCDTGFWVVLASII